MARPKSAEKRNAILLAAIQVFAKGGLAAPTSEISGAAGVAEGTLFTYFPTKDDLIRAVYSDIRREVATAILSGFPRNKGVHDRMHHVWDQFVGWGAAHPEAHKVATQIGEWHGFKGEHSETDLAVRDEFAAMHRLLRQRHPHRGYSPELVQAAVDALGEMTIELMQRNPADASRYRRAGFQLLWTGLAGAAAER
jgi:AcrR family transcriptional regulator